MAKKKLERFSELYTFKNVFQPSYKELSDAFILKSRWNTFFKNKNSVILELGCGKGEYTVSLAENNPDTNFIGIDFKGARLWKGAKTSIEKKLKNVAFIRTKIDFIENVFDKNEIKEIWITFPDPYPKKSDVKKRLTSPDFLNKYKNIIKKDGIIHLKTDNAELFDYTLKVIKTNKHNLLKYTRDIYNSGISNQVTNIQTFYEKIFLKQGLPIYYLKFTL